MINDECQTQIIFNITFLVTQHLHTMPFEMDLPSFDVETIDMSMNSSI